MVGGRITCLEVPAGGATDIDFYSATEATGAQDALVTALTETALVTSGGAWSSGTTKGMTAVPAANEYLYITNGAGAAGGTFTAGKFLIELRLRRLTKRRNSMKVIFIGDPIELERGRKPFAFVHVHVRGNFPHAGRGWT